MSQQKMFPAPVRGWIENENLALNRGVGASVLENWFPEADTVRLRGGALKVADIGSAAVLSLIPYRTATAKLFAASAAAVYDISGLDPDATLTPALAGMTGGDWSYVQFATAGGQFLVMANGEDPVHYYDGTKWEPIVGDPVHKIAYDGLTEAFVVGRTLTGGTSGTTATIVGIQPATATTGSLRITGISGSGFADNEALTGSSSGGAAVANGVSSSTSTVEIDGVTTSDLSRLWIHGSRIWAIEKDTMSAWYLGVDQFGGTATEFFLGGVFRNGGGLLFGETWSSDSGDGMDDRCVFVTTTGEVAVYEGTDPSSVESWALVGRYQIGRPVSAQTMRAGGDLLIATVNGIVPISAVVAKDPAALELASITQAISPSWQRVVSSLASGHLAMAKWPRESMGVVGLPHRAGREAFVVNLETGAWCKFTGWDVQCLSVHNDLLYFGDAAGNVYQAEGAGSDDGAIYVGRMSLLPDHLDTPGNVKSVVLIRAIFRALIPFAPKLSVAMDYRKDFPTPPSVAGGGTAPALWDVGTWDVSMWDDGPDSEQLVTLPTRWKSVGRTGMAVSPQVQVSSGQTRLPDAELVALDLLYEQGGLVV